MYLVCLAINLSTLDAGILIMVQEEMVLLGGGGIQHFSVSLRPLGTNWVFELIGTWLGLVGGG